MNDVVIFSIEDLNFRIDYSECIPSFEIENNSSMLYLNPEVDELRKLNSFIENYLKIYHQAENQHAEIKEIILPYSGIR